MARPTHPAGLEQTYAGGDYSDEERDFILAMERYRRVRGRRFPSCREVLAVLKSLGYRRVAEPEVRSQRPDGRLYDADPRPAA